MGLGFGFGANAPQATKTSKGTTSGGTKAGKGTPQAPAPAKPSGGGGGGGGKADKGTLAPVAPAAPLAQTAGAGRVRAAPAYPGAVAASGPTPQQYGFGYGAGQFSPQPLGAFINIPPLPSSGQFEMQRSPQGPYTPGGPASAQDLGVGYGANPLGTTPGGKTLNESRGVVVGQAPLGEKYPGAGGAGKAQGGGGYGGGGGRGGGGGQVGVSINPADLAGLVPEGTEDIASLLNEIVMREQGQIYEMPPNIRRLLLLAGLTERFHAFMQYLNFGLTGDYDENGFPQDYIVPQNIDMGVLAQLLGELEPDERVIMMQVMAYNIGLEVPQQENLLPPLPQPGA